MPDIPCYSFIDGDWQRIELDSDGMSGEWSLAEIEQPMIMQAIFITPTDRIVIETKSHEIIEEMS